MNESIDPLRGVGVALEIKGGSFAWDMELKAEDLRNINFRADAGKTLLSYRLFTLVISFVFVITITKTHSMTLNVQLNCYHNWIMN